MTREEADILRDLWRFSVSERYTDEEIIKAFDKAIEALKQERPHGEWKQITEPDVWGKTKYQCSVCKYVHRHYEFDTISFCENCGADMRKEGEAE